MVDGSSWAWGRRDGRIGKGCFGLGVELRELLLGRLNLRGTRWNNRVVVRTFSGVGLVFGGFWWLRTDGVRECVGTSQRKEI